MSRMLALTVAAAMITTSAMAQQAPTQPRMAPKPDMMQGMHGEGGKMEGAKMEGGMMAMPDGPGMMLRMRGSLELTENQVTLLQAIQSTAQAAMHTHMGPSMQGMETAAKMLDATTPDFAAYEAELRKAAEHMVLAHSAMGRADVAARAVLTASQRERLALGRRMMDEMKPMHDMKPMHETKPTPEPKP